MAAPLRCLQSVPFYMTNKGYGIYVDHTDNVSFEVASEKVEYVGFSVPGEELKYCFIYGPTLQGNLNTILLYRTPRASSGMELRPLAVHLLYHQL